MDAKDLRTESAVNERNDDVSKYTQGSVVLQCHRNKPYHDIGPNALAKTESAPVRPCAVIGPDRVVPPPSSNDAYPKKSSIEPWLSTENVYRRPPDYPHKTLTPSRNISPRQTFQENMPRIMVPPTYNTIKPMEDSNFSPNSDRGVPLSKNMKSNMAPEAKYCDVPYVINSLPNEHKNVKESEMCVPGVNSSLPRTAPHVWPPHSVTLHPPRTYGASEIYSQYQQYPSCAGPRPIIPLSRPHRIIQEDAGFMYSDPYYQDGNVPYKPYPPMKERYPQPPRYEYLSNYSSPFHLPPHFPQHKYDIPKSTQPHPYSVYPHLKYIDNRIPDPAIEGYQRPPNQQPHYNIQFRGQLVHPGYASVPGNPVQNKLPPYPTDVSSKSVTPNKLSFENNNKMYVDYDSARGKPYPIPENYFINEMARGHPVKNQMIMPNYQPVGMHSMTPPQYYRKENIQMKSYEYMPHYRNYEPSLNNPMIRQSTQFSPNILSMSPSESHMNSDIQQVHGALQEDFGYASQPSAVSLRSTDSIYKLTNEHCKRVDYRYGPIGGNMQSLPKSSLNSNTSTNSKDKKQINVRQFLQMWNDGEEENAENISTKEVVIQTGSSDTNHYMKQQHSEEQLYVLGLVNVPNDQLGKYEHIQKVSKLPENIKGYNSLELLDQFEEVIESSKQNCGLPETKDYQMPFKSNTPKNMDSLLQRPVSPLDVEAKISQSVIHKDVGCNFEIKPCSPKMLNVEIAPAPNVIDERVIEKVSNPLSKISKSPLPLATDQKSTYNKTLMQDKSFTLNENPSCNMVGSPYAVTNINSVKSNFIQDLEINAGVCLASLPRLDNEIELNFPEVNQQFIDANKKDSLPITSEKRSENIDGCIEDDNKLEQNVSKDKDMPSVFDSDKISMKLSKYRKAKATEYVESVPISNATRTDSVIIKNPENVKNIEDNLVEINISTPLNLTSQAFDDNNSSFGHINEDSVLPSNDIDMALDFSLNKSNDSLCAIDCNSPSCQDKPPKDPKSKKEINEPAENITIDEEANHNAIRPEISPHENIKCDIKPLNKSTERDVLDENALNCVIKSSDTAVFNEDFPDTSTKNNSTYLCVNKDIDLLQDTEIKSPSHTTEVNENVSVVKNATMSNETDPGQRLTIFHENIDNENKINDDSEQEAKRHTMNIRSPISSNITSSLEINVSKHNTLMDDTNSLTNSDDSSVINENSEALQSEAKFAFSDMENNNNFTKSEDKDSGHEKLSDLTRQKLNNTNVTMTNYSDNCSLPTFTFSDDIHKTEDEIFGEDDQLTSEKFDLTCKNMKDKNDYHFLPKEIISNTQNNSLKNNSLDTELCDPIPINMEIEPTSDRLDNTSSLQILIDNKENNSNFLRSKSENEYRLKKELYSPWIQKLWLCLEGKCSIGFVKENNSTYHHTKEIKHDILINSNLIVDSEQNSNKSSKTNHFSECLNSSFNGTQDSKLKLKDNNDLSKAADSLNQNCFPKHLPSHQNVEVQPEVNTFFDNALISFDNENTENSTTFTKKVDTISEFNYNSNNTDIGNDKQNAESSIFEDNVLNEVSDNCKDTNYKVKEIDCNKDTMDCNKLSNDIAINSVINIDFKIDSNKTEENVMRDEEQDNTLFNTPVNESNDPKKHPQEPDSYFSEDPKADTTTFEKDDFRITQPDDDYILEDVSDSKNNESATISSESNDEINRILQNKSKSKQDIEHSLEPYSPSDSPHSFNSDSIENIVFEHSSDESNGIFSNDDETNSVSKNTKCNDENEINETEKFTPIKNTLLNSGLLNSITKFSSRSDDAEEGLLCNEESKLLNEENNVAVIGNVDKLIDNSEDNKEGCPDGTFNLEINTKNTKETKRPLKRSYSDSALFPCNGRTNNQRELNSSDPFSWPSKRQRTEDSENDEHVTEKVCGLIENNRRNSVSSFYNEENISFCILIDNDCMLSEDNEQDKICFAELSEDCIAEVDTTSADENVHLLQETAYTQNSDDVQFSNAVVLNYEDEKTLEDTWIDNVACVETVVSEDIAEDVVMGLAASPKDIEVAQYDDSGIFNCDINDHMDRGNYLYESILDSNYPIVETMYGSPHLDVNRSLLNEGCPGNELLGMAYDNEGLEKILSESNSRDCSPSPTPDRIEPLFSHQVIIPNLPDNKENIFLDIKKEIQNRESTSGVGTQNVVLSGNTSFEAIEDIINTCESTIIASNYKENEEELDCASSSSPEVSSTTPEEKSTSILLKITKYNGSRISQINEIKSSKPRCKFTEVKEYSKSESKFPNRPLRTKAAQKYIPPVTDAVRDLKVKLSLPQQRLIKLKQLKQSKNEPKLLKQSSSKIIPKKAKPNFEDVLKSIDEIQIKKHKEKSKKGKDIVPKVVIKKNQNGSHYTSSSRAEPRDPDLTGRRWQPWVFLEKCQFIDKMATRNKTKAIFNHRRNTYVLAEKFKKYKSVQNSTKFIISHETKTSDASKGHLKYTIRLKHTY